MFDDVIRASFWSKVDVRGPDECWEWLGTKGARGYGRFMRQPATHASLALDSRPRPGRLFALHACDNPPCVNPRHLRWGTHKDNANDAIQRGRLHRWNGERAGALNPKAKLTSEQVSEIRAIHREGKLGWRRLGRLYNVDRCTIRDITRGTTWRT